MSDIRPGQSIFTRGAVDLGALKNRPAAATPAAPAASDTPPPPLPGGANVIEVTEANVQAEVLERSLKTPVIVAFVVEHPEVDVYVQDLVQQNAADAGAWTLALVDVQNQQRLAQMFRVQQVPMVYAVVGGQPIDAQPGLIPPADLRKWLDAILRAGGVEVEVPEDPRLADADEALISGDLDAAEAAYKKILADAPKDEGATAGLAHVVLAKRVKGLDPNTVLQQAADTPDDISAQLQAADVEVLSGMAEQAYQRLVNLVRRVYGDDRETVRQHLVSLFAVAGPDDPAVATARRALASALF